MSWLLRIAIAAVLVVIGWSESKARPVIPRAAVQYRAELTRVAHAEWGLDAPIAAFAGQIHQESGWRTDAVSRVGALGMAQFMPATAKWWCERLRLSATDCQPNNPRWAMRALVGYDRWLFERVRGESDFDRLWAALRSYNGGLGHWLAEAKLSNNVGWVSDSVIHRTAYDRLAVDAQCGKAKRAAVHCAENLGYPRRILLTLQPLYASWGGEVAP